VNANRVPDLDLGQVLAHLLGFNWSIIRLII